MSLQRCKTLHAKRCKVTNKLREVRRTLSHMYGRPYGTTEGRNVVLNPVPSQSSARVQFLLSDQLQNTPQKCLIHFS